MAQSELRAMRCLEIPLLTYLLTYLITYLDAEPQLLL